MPEHWLPRLPTPEEERLRALALSAGTEWAVRYNRLTVAELRETSDAVLCRCDYLGPGRVAEIRRALSSRGPGRAGR